MSLGEQQKNWNKQQKIFRQTLLAFDRHEQAIEMFLRQHAALHAAEMAQTGSWSYEDEIMQDLEDVHARQIPNNGEHSIVWVLWHLARIEDVTMNMLVAGQAQLMNSEGWLARLQVDAAHTGNAMDVDAVAGISTAIDIDALRGYRLAVGRRTREIVSALTPAAVKQKVDPVRIQRIVDEGAVVPEAHSIVAYWRKRNIAGLLLMPPTRHGFLHLNEASRIKERVVRS